jgi:hypothetical protein
MSQLYYGSINIDELMEHLKNKHTAFVKGNNGKIYANISVWLNDEEDKYGNVMSIKLSATKEAIKEDAEQGKIYIGNCKESEYKEPEAVNDKDANKFANYKNDLPF